MFQVKPLKMSNKILLLLILGLFSGLGIHSFAYLLISLKPNERLWAIRSDRSNQMSDCERFAQIAQNKWATMSESLRSLRGNEPPWANCSGRSRQMSKHEQFAQVAQRKWAIVSEWLRLLTKNERMSESLIFLSKLLIHSFLNKKCAICSEIKWANSQPCFFKGIFGVFWGLLLPCPGWKSIRSK